MKLRWLALVTAAAVGGGCVPSNFVVAPPAAATDPVPAKAASARPAYSPPVTAGQITRTVTTSRQLQLGIKLLF